MMNHKRVALCLCLAAAAAGQQPSKFYPKAKLDKAATEQARTAPTAQPDVEVAVYTTADSFDKVYAFYQKAGKEYKAVIGSGVRKLPNGADLREAFFILDGAPDLRSSKYWLKIQRPYIGQYGLARNGDLRKEIQDVTAIILAKHK
jgi:hypothetical protein